MADFLIVYINEAHPKDEWHMEKLIQYNQPKTLEERKAIVQRLLDELKPQQGMAIDDITDDMMRAYEAWPERLYVVENGKVLYKGGIGPFFYLPEELKEWLEKYSASKQE